MLNGLRAVVCLTSGFVGYGQTIGSTATDIEKMLAAKMSESVIIAKVKQDAPVSLTVDEIIRLKALGASDTLIENILRPTQAIAPPLSAQETRLEQGVYAQKEGKWVEVVPELVNLKSSGILKAYTFRMDLNGKIAGASSKSTLKTPLDILLVTPEGVNASEYILVRLRVKATFREYRSASSGVGGTKVGVERDVISFDYTKTQPGQYRLKLPSTVVAGEYAFLPPMGAGVGAMGGPGATAGKAYTFRVAE